MVTKNVNDAVGLLHDIEEVRHKQINNLLNEIDDHLTTLTNTLNLTCDREFGSMEDDYCDECGELYPDDCVCEEDDYMDDDDDDYDICGEAGCWCNPDNVCNIEVVAPPLNAFARARWLNENH